MSNYNDDYEDKILRIKAEFINFLKKDLKKNSDENIDQKEIRKSVYKFIFDKVSDKELKGIKGLKGINGKNEKKVLFFHFYCNVVDFCLSFGGLIIDVLSDLKRYQDFEKLKINDSEIDA